MVYFDPKTIYEVLELLDSLKGENVVILAGGTDVVPKLNVRPERSGYFDKGLADMDKKLVYIGDLGLSYIKDEGDKIVVGTMTTLTELLESEVIDKVPVLKEALSVLAGVTVRNAATLGGNIMNASPAADSVEALIALDAKLVIASVDGEREEGIYTIFAAPGKTTLKDNEFIKEIIIPIKPGKASFIKFGRRKAESLSVVNGASYLQTEDGVCKEAIITLGAVAPTPLRIQAAEELLIGKEVTDELIEEAAEIAAGIVKPIDDQRASGEYRVKLVKTIVKRTLAAAK